MWYFSWLLGTALACCFAILTAVWFELHENSCVEEKQTDFS